MGAGLSARPLPVTPPEPSYDASLYDADAKWPGAASPRKDQNTTVSHPEPSGLVIVHDGAWETYREDFMIQLRGFAGFEFWQGVRSRDDFERLRSVFEQECGTPLVSMGPLPKRPEFIQMSPWKWACYLRETRSGLQRWLDAAISSRLCDNMLWRTLLSRALDVKVSQTCPDAWLDLAHAVLGLPTMMNIMSFLEEPKDVVRLCNLSAGWICHGTVPFCPKQWIPISKETMYSDRWPAFYEAQRYVSNLSHSEVDWKSMYWHTLAGKFETLLEAYDREKKLGFAMSCMLAKAGTRMGLEALDEKPPFDLAEVSWDSDINCYIAKYVSASQVLPEKIPYHEGYRLRFCPPSARSLKPEMMPPQASELYGYRVLEGIPELKVGQGVELQWKMQQGSPFGWWFGTVESLERDAGGSRAKVTMIFDHFPASSRWRRLQIIIGDGVVRQCAIGGWHGGVRAVTEEEKKDWVKFYPKEPVIF